MLNDQVAQNAVYRHPRLGSRASERFGVRPADNDLCTAEKRPTALDTSYDLSYQWKSTGVAECDAFFAQLPTG